MSRKFSVLLCAIVALASVAGSGLFGPAPALAASGILQMETPLHEAPDPGSAMLALLPEGTDVTIQGAPIDGFYPVAAGGLTGWMRGETLELTKDEVDPNIAAETGDVAGAEGDIPAAGVDGAVDGAIVEGVADESGASGVVDGGGVDAGAEATDDGTGVVDDGTAIVDDGSGAVDDSAAVEATDDGSVPVEEAAVEEPLEQAPFQQEVAPDGQQPADAAVTTATLAEETTVEPAPVVEEPGQREPEQVGEATTADDAAVETATMATDATAESVETAAPVAPATTDPATAPVDPAAAPADTAAVTGEPANPAVEPAGDAVAPAAEQPPAASAVPADGAVPAGTVVPAQSLDAAATTTPIAAQPAITPTSTPVVTPEPTPELIVNGPAYVLTDMPVLGGPGPDYSLIFTVPAGSTLLRTGESKNGYISVQYKEVYGWAPANEMSEPIAVAAEDPEEAPVDTRDPRPGSGVAFATVDLSLRAGPSANEDPIVVVPAGSRVILTGVMEGEFQRVTYGDQVGWISNEFLETPENPAPNGEGTGRQENYSHKQVVRYIYAAADRYGQSRSDMLRVATCESNLDPYAVNPSGSYGLFQFIRSTWKSTPYGDEDIFDPQANANAAAWMWKQGRKSEWVCQ